MAYCRHAVKGQLPAALGLLFFGALFAGFAFIGIRQAGEAAWLLFFVVGMLSMCFGGWLAIRWRPSHDPMESAIGKWIDQGRDIPRLLREPELGISPPEWDEPDIYDYGVEAILIVQREILVDLFVKNGFHAERRCLVVSESGYPSYVVQRMRLLLEERPDLPVYLLHDSTHEGEAMAGRVEASLRLPPRDRSVIDLGLFRSDVRRLSRLRAVLSARGSDQAAVDYLPYSMLVSGLSQAFDEQTTLAGILDRQGADGYVSSSFG